MLATRAEQWKQEWLSERRLEGRAEGERLGEATILLRQLEHRFGPVSSSAGTA